MAAVSVKRSIWDLTSKEHAQVKREQTKKAGEKADEKPYNWNYLIS